MADNNVIDLTSPPAGRMTRSLKFSPAAAAKLTRNDPYDVGYIADDHGDVLLVDTYGRARPSRHGRRRRRDVDAATSQSRRFKTDPNERAEEKVIVIDTRKSPPPSKQTSLPPGLSAAECAVLDVFPDLELAHLKSLLQQHSHKADLVIMHLIDCPSYPKETKLTTMCGSPLVKLDRRKWSYDFMAQSSFDALLYPEYCAGTRSLIHNLLPFLTVKALTKLLEKHHYRYAICHDRILTALKAGTQDEVEQYRQVESAIRNGRLMRPDAQKSALAGLTGFSVDRAFLKSARSPRKQGESLPVDPILQEEVAYVDSKYQEYSSGMVARIDRLRHKMEADRTGTGLECACCFDTYDLDGMVACRDYGHLCCCACFNQFASTKMWGDGNFGVDKSTKEPFLDLICFNGGGDECSSCFDRYSLVKALDAKNLQKYDELQCQLAVDQVYGDDLVSCPKCGYRAALPEGQKIFSCPVEDCLFESCRECGEAAHIPFRCDEVEKEVEAKGRLTVEEAITQARVRRCPNQRCKQPFVKSDGCNKVKCACGTLVCYVCRVAIKAYTHFCQTAHCQHESCGKCPLWTKAEEDDARAMREAGIEAAEAAATDAGVKINVDAILKAGVPVTTVAAVAAPAR